MSDFLPTEQRIEDELCQKLIGLGYTQRTDITTSDDVINNIKKHIERLNKEGDGSLDNNELDNNLFQTYFINKVYNNSIFQNGKMIRDGLQIPLGESNKNLYLKLFDKKNIDNNIFEFATQVKHKSANSRNGNRSDLTIFINGIPIVQIELKRDNIDIQEAFNQIERYKRESFDIDNIYKLVQIFVITNKTSTKYFANSDKINNKYCFNWTDENNKHPENVYRVADLMLNKETLFELVIKFMVFCDENNQDTIMILRPYQYYAIYSILERLKETKNLNNIIINPDERSKNLNCYVWHATGSGKTLTSFKLAQIISEDLTFGVEKVVFLVDRLDLNHQTLKNFNIFLGNNNKDDDIKSIENTKELEKQILDPTKKIIITTMQKMNNLLTNPKYQFAKKYNEFINKNFIFIVDECHRTQFGDMHKLLRKSFCNSRFIGFTGTPIFPSTSKNYSTTADIFGDCIHNYKMVDAISDKSVLPFKIEYISGPKAKLKVDQDVDKEVEQIDIKGFFKSDEYIEKIVDYIHQINDKKTFNKEYKSMLVTADIETAYKYYFKFREKYHDLKVAVLFSKSDSNGDNNPVGTDEQENNVFVNEYLKNVFEAYNQDYNKNYRHETDFKKYSINIQNDLKDQKGEINLIIVVRMLTTGFDAKKINTIYLDRSLKLHDLIQTISRANRVEKPKKEQANIISFRTFKKDVDEAIQLYCHDNGITQVFLKDTLTNVVNEINKIIKNIETKWPTISDIKNEKLESNKLEFIKNMKKFNKLFNLAKSFIEFEPKMINWNIETIEGYRNVQREIKNLLDKSPNTESILNDIDFELDIIATDSINVDYIIQLLENTQKITNKSVFIAEVDKIIEKIEKNNLYSKKKLIIKFIEEWKKKMLNNFEENILKESFLENEYREFCLDFTLNKIKEFSTINNIGFDFLLEIITMQSKEKESDDHYELISNYLDNKGYSFLEKDEKVKEVINFINDIKLESPIEEINQYLYQKKF